MPQHSNARYIYRRRLSFWAVYKITVLSTGTEIETKITSFGSKEEAEKEVYKLNGWKLKNKRL
ncbi:MAG: hypothetical protein RSA53_05380 [Odoribacter sp.]